MPATKVNLSQMVDLAVITPRVGAVNSNALHTLLHAMLRQLNIVDVQANFNDYDRDVLSALKARELSVLSDIDSGVGDNAEDALGLALGERSSFMPTATPSTGKRTPHQWHHQVDAEDTFRLRLSIDSKRSSCMPIPRLRTRKRTPQHHQVASIQDPEEELNNISSVPSNKHLFRRATTPNKGKPIAEMWLSMLLFRVQTNEKGIDKCMSMMEDMTKEMQAHRDEHKMQMDQIKGLNIDDVMKRIDAMEKSMNEMNDKVHTLPFPDDFAKFVTEAELEDALQGTRQDWENLQQPTGRVVVEMSSQTDPVADMRKKLDPGALDGLNVSSEILEQLRELKEQVDTLAAAREKMSDPIQDLLRHEHEMHTLSITELQMKFALLEDDLYQIQDMIEHDSTRWEIKHGTKYEEEIRNVFLQNEPDKTRNLAYVVNDQQHDIREDIITMEEDLKIKAIQFVQIPFVQDKPEPVEIPSELTKSTGFKDTDHDALLKLQNANSKEFEKLFAYSDELQVNKADGTEVGAATYCDELQVNNAIRTEVAVATYSDELHVNKADRTEVEIATYCDELQVNKADRTEVDIATYCDELQVNKADRTEVDIATYCDELQVNKADRTEVDIATYCDEVQVNKADRTEVDIATYCDELQVNNVIRTEVAVATYCDELQVNKADRTEVDVKADKRTLENNSLFDTKTNDINKMIKKILNNLAVKDEAWNQQCKVFSDDIDRKLNHVELKSLKEWLLRRLEALNDQLNEQNQAPVRRLEALNDKLPTGDTSTCTSSSGSNSLFDTETNDSKMIKEILIIIAVNEEAWNQQCKVFSDDIDGKLDDLEFKPVKDWLLRRLKKLNDKLKKQNQSHVRKLKALNDMLPTGPVPSSMTSVSSHQALHPTISPRPDLNLEMDQILQHPKSDTVKQEAKKRKYGQKVFKFISKMMKPCRKAKSQ